MRVSYILPVALFLGGARFCISSPVNHSYDPDPVSNGNTTVLDFPDLYDNHSNSLLNQPSVLIGKPKKSKKLRCQGTGERAIPKKGVVLKNWKEYPNCQQLEKVVPGWHKTHGWKKFATCCQGLAWAIDNCAYDLGHVWNIYNSCMSRICDHQSNIFKQAWCAVEHSIFAHQKFAKIDEQWFRDATDKRCECVKGV